MRQEFKESLEDTVVGSPVPGSGPLESESTEAHSSSPPWVICSCHQHLVDYVKIFMKEGEELTVGEDQLASLVTEVPPYFSI